MLRGFRNEYKIGGKWLLPLVATTLLASSGCGGGASDGADERSDVNGLSGSELKAALTPQKKSSGMVGDRMSGVVYKRANATPQDPSPFRFTDIRPGSGVDFKHVSGMDRDKHFPTANGSGVAIFDYDGDGLMDLYFASFNPMPPDKPRPGQNRLYRNQGDGKFEDVTDKAGVGYQGLCHGAIAADLDNDGDQDLVLCNYGPNVLYVNNGDGTFTDKSAPSGIGRPGWSSGGAVLDYDNDGDLDLYLSNYGDWNYPADDKFCGDPASNLRLYCSPREIRLTQHFLYRNNGDLTFTEVAKEAGVWREPSQQGHGFGVVTADLDDDGDVDIYVANDMNPNFLFLNNGDGTFEDTTELSGAAYDDKGNAQSGMATDAEDVDGDGRPELIVTNFANEYTTLYQNLGNGIFYDQTPAFGLAAETMPWVSWGCGFVDIDNDGWPDIFVANGHVDDNREGQEFGEPPLLFRNVPLDGTPDASRRFKIATRDVGDYFASIHVTRGCAFGDLDNDGDLDIVTNNFDSHPGILRNDTPTASQPNHSLRLKLVGHKSNRDAYGARVEVVVGDLTIHRQRKGGSSLESSHDPRLLIGIGPNPSADKVTIKWPSGMVTTLENVEVDQLHEVQEPAQDMAAAAKPAGS